MGSFGIINGLFAKWGSRSKQEPFFRGHPPLEMATLHNNLAPKESDLSRMNATVLGNNTAAIDSSVATRSFFTTSLLGRFVAWLLFCAIILPIGSWSTMETASATATDRSAIVNTPTAAMREHSTPYKSSQTHWSSMAGIALLSFIALAVTAYVIWLNVGLRRSILQGQQELIERKQMEKKLRTLHRAVEQSSSTIVITNANGDIEYTNPQFELSTGYTRKEAEGQNPRILKSGRHSPEFYEKLWRTVSSGQQWRGEFINCRKDGSLYWESACISPVFDEQGSIMQYVAVKDDITDRKRTESQIAQHVSALESANKALKKLSQEEKKISATLTEKLEEVEAFNRLAIGRELRMIELKEEVNDLLAQLGLPAKYEIAEAEVSV